MPCAESAGCCCIGIAKRRERLRLAPRPMSQRLGGNAGGIAETRGALRPLRFLLQALPSFGSSVRIKEEKEPSKKHERRLYRPAGSKKSITRLRVKALKEGDIHVSGHAWRRARASRQPRRRARERATAPRKRRSGNIKNDCSARRGKLVLEEGGFSTPADASTADVRGGLEIQRQGGDRRVL